jgi:hypothetical protein
MANELARCYLMAAIRAAARSPTRSLEMARRPSTSALTSRRSGTVRSGFISGSTVAAWRGLPPIRIPWCPNRSGKSLGFLRDTKARTIPARPRTWFISCAAFRAWRKSNPPFVALIRIGVRRSVTPSLSRACVRRSRRGDGNCRSCTRRNSATTRVSSDRGCWSRATAFGNFRSQSPAPAGLTSRLNRLLKNADPSFRGPCLPEESALFFASVRRADPSPRSG